MTFFVRVRRFNVAGPINDKSWNLNQCTSYANVLVTTIKALENTTHSYKNKTKKRPLGIAPLKETLPKLMIFFSSKPLWRKKMSLQFSARQFNMALYQTTSSLINLYIN